MAQKRNWTRRYDAQFASLIVFILVFCVLALVFTCVRGADVMFYAGFPMLASALCCVVSNTCVEGFASQQIARRITRNKTANAMVLLRGCVLLSVLWGVLIVVLMVILAGQVAEGVLGSDLAAPVLICFAPAVALSGLSGSLKGFLSVVSEKRTALLILLLETIIFLGMGLLLGFCGTAWGESIGALLRNEDISAVYCGCGIALGLDLAEILSCIVLAILCRLAAGRMHIRKNPREAFLEDAEQTESLSDVMKYAAQKTAGGFAIAMMLFLGLLIAYRFWLTGQDGEETNILISEWGGFMGVSLPVTAGCALVCTLPLTSLAAGLVRDQEKGRFKTMRSRLSVVLRLSAYGSLPCTAFLFSAAQIIIAVFPGLTFTAQDAAILTIRTGSFLVFLGSTSLLMLYFFWETMNRREVVAAAAAGFFVQVVLTVVLDLAGLELSLCTWTANACCLVFLLTLFLLGKQGLIRGFDGDWMAGVVLLAICSVIAALPIAFLSEYLLQVLPAVAALVVSAAVFAFLYALLTILLRAADLHNVSRLPGGGMIVSLAILLGVAGREEE